MLDLTEIIWALLPILFILLSIWSVLKHLFGIFGEEPLSFYLKQLLFCSLLFALAVVISRTETFAKAAELPVISIMPFGLYKFLLYPLLLVLSSIFVDYKAKNKN